jgi:hypothetical protein
MPYSKEDSTSSRLRSAYTQQHRQSRPTKKKLVYDANMMHIELSNASSLIGFVAESMNLHSGI